MARLLHAWEGTRLVGVFRESDSGDVSFSYAEGATVPISLSLPLDGEWSRNAPFFFLDGLLPDNNNERYVMQNSLGASSIHPFDLLESVDAAGGLCFTASAEPPQRDMGALVPMSDSDIEAEIASRENRVLTGYEVERNAKFSLAGTQGKFTMVRFGGSWYRPNVGLASTHIVKPDIRGLKESSLVECATMDLAESAGVEVPAHGMIEAGDRSAYIVSRFDRTIGEDGLARRIRTEDLTQALALSCNEKYDVELSDAAALLRATDPSDELAYAWFSQVAFNVLSGNCDAHGKNYSLVFSPEGISLSPIYDAVNTLMWDTFDQGIAMPVNEKYYSWEISPDDWAFAAESSGLDGDRVRESAQAVSDRIMGHVEQAALRLADCGGSLAERFMSSVVRANAGMEHRSPRAVARAAMRSCKRSSTDCGTETFGTRSI